MGIVIVAISGISSTALSLLGEEQWSNYMLHWNLKRETPVKAGETEQHNVSELFIARR